VNFADYWENAEVYETHLASAAARLTARSAYRLRAPPAS
jgi:hypothetical protein